MPISPRDWGLNMFDARTMAAIKAAEGCRLHSYKDSLGFWTIGYGHLMDQTKPCVGVTITQEEAERLFLMDIADAKRLALTLPEACGINGVRFNALLELVFNLGLAKWKMFVHTRDAIQHQKWDEVEKGLLNSLWAKQVGPERSKRIASMLVTGNYPE